MGRDGGREGRYLAVDSLRGIAALSVVFYHLHRTVFQSMQGDAIQFLTCIFQYGYLGVPIFFVISGFVISASVQAPKVNFRYVGKFMLRRSFRLDPPYWFSMFLDISFIWITIRAFHLSQTMPSTGKIIAHMFYAQDLLGLGNISAIYWTLCLEVQFYIFFTLIFALSNKVDHANFRRNIAFFVIFFATICSVAISAGVMKNPIDGLFLSHWYLFVLGVCCYKAGVEKKLPNQFALAYFAVIFLLFIYQYSTSPGFSFNTLAALVTAIFLFFAASRNKLSVWLTGKYFLYLGSISYSLYLFHGIVGDRFISFFVKWVFPKFHVVETSSVAILLFSAAILFAVLFADVVYRFIERPCMGFSKAIKLT